MKKYFSIARSFLFASMCIGFLTAPAMLYIHELAAKRYSLQSICQTETKKESKNAFKMPDIKRTFKQLF
jgi:hypothetical protein